MSSYCGYHLVHNILRLTDPKQWCSYTHHPLSQSDLPSDFTSFLIHKTLGDQLIYTGKYEHNLGQIHVFKLPITKKYRKHQNFKKSFKICLNTCLMPMLSNFELLTPLHPLLAQVNVLKPLDFPEVPLFPTRSSYDVIPNYSHEGEREL